MQRFTGLLALGLFAVSSVACCGDGSNSKNGPSDNTSKTGSTAQDTDQDKEKKRAKSALDRYEESAKASSDPTEVWIAALEDKNPYVLERVIVKLAGSKDRRVIEPLRRFASRRSGDERHDDLPLADQAMYAIEKVEADLLWDAHMRPDLKDLEKVTVALDLWKSHPGNHELVGYIRTLFLKSDDERIIPFLIWDMKQESEEKLQSFGQKAGPFLLDAITSAKFERMRRSAVATAGILRIKEAVEPMAALLRGIRAKEARGDKADYDRSELASMLVWSLAHYGEEILDAMKGETVNEDPFVRKNFYTVIGRIGGAKALEILRQARDKEPSRDFSDGVNVLEALDYYIRKIEGGKDE